MGHAIDMTGQKIGYLTVIKRDYDKIRGTKNALWKCQCVCGNIKTYSRKDLISKTGIRSCGCKQHEKKLEFRMENISEYNIWRGMKQRCYNKNYKQYKDYGGRGIYICERWLNSFDNFFLDMGSRPSSVHSIERIDNNKNYSPDNCKWALRTEQNRNRRYNVIENIEKAEEIRELYKTGKYTQKQLSLIYKCEEPIIWQIINNYSWKK